MGKKEGYISELTIVRCNDYQELSEELRRTMERVGIFVTQALKAMTNKAVIWSPNWYKTTITKPHGEAFRIKGGSLELPLAIILFAAMTRKPVPQNLSATGVIDEHGRLRPVDGIALKLKAIQREKPSIQCVVVPFGQKIPRCAIGNGFKIIEAATLKDALSLLFSAPYHVEDIDLAVEESNLKNRYDQKDFLTCINNATEIIELLEENRDSVLCNKDARTLFTCYWRRGSCYCHQGHVEMAMADLNKVKQMYNEYQGVIEYRNYLACLNNYAVALKDVFSYAEAEKIHKDIYKALKSVKAMDHEKGKNISSWSQLFLSMGRYVDAERLQKKAIELIDEDSSFRNYSYLAQIYTRWNKLDEAQAALEEATKWLNQADTQKQKENLPYLHWIEAEILIPANNGRRWLHGQVTESSCTL